MEDQIEVELEKTKQLDRMIVKHLLEYRKITETFLIGAKGGGTNRAIVVSEM